MRAVAARLEAGADGALQPLRDQRATRRGVAGPRARPLRAAPAHRRPDRRPPGLRGRPPAAARGIIAINSGWASLTVARDLDPRGPSHDVEAMLLQLPAEHFPLTVATAAEWGSYGSDHDYDFVLGRFLNGLAK
jgi:hypothetical protein